MTAAGEKGKHCLKVYFKKCKSMVRPFQSVSLVVHSSYLEGKTLEDDSKAPRHAWNVSLESCPMHAHHRCVGIIHT